MSAAAYFDVDGTVTPLTTMFELLLFDARERSRQEHGHEFLARLRTMKAAGEPREVTNREYYTWWRGRRYSDVLSVGRRWFSSVSEAYGDGIIYAEVRRAIHEHQLRGDRIVLVSGSFTPALQPLAEMIGADDLLVTEPELIGGVYTGTAAAPMIGTQKATAVSKYAALHDLDLHDCTAYGDDQSDMDFLQLTGTPTAVGPSGAHFIATTHQLGWSSLAVTTEGTSCE